MKPAVDYLEPYDCSASDLLTAARYGGSLGKLVADLSEEPADNVEKVDHAGDTATRWEKFRKGS